MSIFNALECIMVMEATLLAWWKMNPTLQPQTKPPCLWPCGEKMSSQGTETQTFAQVLAAHQWCTCQVFQLDVTLF